MKEIENKDNTFTIEKNGTIYKTLPMDKAEFEEMQYNTAEDWKDFLRNSESYYKVKEYIIDVFDQKIVAGIANKIGGEIVDENDSLILALCGDEYTLYKKLADIMDTDFRITERIKF